MGGGGACAVLSLTQRLPGGAGRLRCPVPYTLLGYGVQYYSHCSFLAPRHKVLF